MKHRGLSTSQVPAEPTSHLERPRVRGKLLSAEDQQLWIRGVTYGTFRPNEDGEQYPEKAVVQRDFGSMTAQSINAIRVYTVPPRWLLDAALDAGLYVMVGLPWEQHVAFLDDKKRVRSIEARVRSGVRECGRHAAILCYAIGNEIPASIVRWHGRRPVEKFLERLYWAAKDEDPTGLVTYVNYPSTEYLQLPFVDFVCFNVYLEAQTHLNAYLARLQNLAGDRPLILTEIGLDSRRNGEATQARVIDWQLQEVFSGGCAGAFVFAWTDEWHRGGHDVEDWDFGLTDRKRDPKKSLAVVSRRFSELPVPKDGPCPRISVVVCTFNGARTIRDCLEGLKRLEYPDFEVIVVNDGSTDGTKNIVKAYGFRLISGQNRGLGTARNTGLQAATGDIVAYIDDDAYPDPHWLLYLAHAFCTTRHAGIGGPNIPPAQDGLVAQLVARAPGGANHVLVSDTEAEHIPGCNMAFRKAALEAIGGFDPQFRIAGDDVDVCWRIQERGWTLGFSPAAMVWHHRRSSVRAYWRQQVNYGKAEALLERKWPERYNGLGHPAWKGRLYGNGAVHGLGFGRGRIYHGTWGNGLFQSIYAPTQGRLASLSLMPEWIVLGLALFILSTLGFLWPPLLLLWPLCGLAVGASFAHAMLRSSRAASPIGHRSLGKRVGSHCLLIFLCLVQPLARFYGRVLGGLTPWRRRGAFFWVFPRRRRCALWCEYWQSGEERGRAVRSGLASQGAVVTSGGDFDHWDLEVRGGLFSSIRIRMAVEEHGSGKQLIRVCWWPRFSWPALGILFLLASLSIAAAASAAWVVCAAVGLATLILGVQPFLEYSAAHGALVRTLAIVSSSARWEEVAPEAAAESFRTGAIVPVRDARLGPSEVMSSGERVSLPQKGSTLKAGATRVGRAPQATL